MSSSSTPKPLYLASTMKQLEDTTKLPSHSSFRLVGDLLVTLSKLFKEAELRSQEGDEESSFVLYTKFTNLARIVMGRNEYRFNTKDGIDMGRISRAISCSERLHRSLSRRYEEEEKDFKRPGLLDGGFEDFAFRYPTVVSDDPGKRREMLIDRAAAAAERRLQSAAEIPSLKLKKEKVLEEAKKLQADIQDKESRLRISEDETKIVQEELTYLNMEMGRMRDKVKKTQDRLQVEEMKQQALTKDLEELTSKLTTLRIMDVLRRQLNDMDPIPMGQFGTANAGRNNHSPDKEKSTCHVCFVSPKQVFCCRKCDNWVCQDCEDRVVTCPSCRQDLVAKPLRRNRAVERILGV